MELARLDQDKEVRKTLDDFLTMINKKPNSKFIKKNPFANNTSYIEVGQLENMLDMIFQEWSMEVKDVSLICNSITVTVSVTVTNPVTGNMMTRDGVGACPIELTKGALPTDFTKIQSKALHKNLPAAKSFAFKNAVQSIGVAFGRSLNRSETNFVGLYSKQEEGEVLN